MKYTQSAYILSLLFASTQAIRLVSQEEPKEKAEKPMLPPEKVHNLLPTHTQDLSNNMDPEFTTYPLPIGIGAGRTAFYGQMPQALVENENYRLQGHRDIGDKEIDEGVHGFVANDRNVLPDPRPRTNVAYPANGVHNPKWEWLDKQALAQHHSHHHHHHTDIGDKEIDPEVHGVVSNDKNVLPEPRPRTNVAYSANGQKNSEWHWLDVPEKKETNKSALSQNQKRDIGDKEIEEHVHGFAANDRNVLPEPYPRQNVPYPANGSRNSGWHWLDKPELKSGLAQRSHHHHHHHKDIGDKEIEEHVHGFAANDRNVLPEPYPKQNVPYPANGSRNSEWAWLDKPEKQASLSQHHHHHHHKSKDVGDNGIDEEVHQFVTNDKSVLPEPRRRQKEAYPINGFKNPEWQWLDSDPTSLSQKKDIGDVNIDEGVHGFAAADKNVLPLPRRRQKVAYPINGFKNPTWQWLDKPAPASLSQKKDIGDVDIDEEVHGFVAADKNVLPMPRRRQKVAYPVNGFKNASWQWLDKPEPTKKPQGLVQKMDIGNSKYVRPDVFQFVDDVIGQTPQWRIPAGPTVNFESSHSGQGIEIVSNGPQAQGKGLIVPTPAPPAKK